MNVRFGKLRRRVFYNEDTDGATRSTRTYYKNWNPGEPAEFGHRAVLEDWYPYLLSDEELDESLTQDWVQYLRAAGHWRWPNNPSRRNKKKYKFKNKNE